jgi:hypothetical protein
MNPASAIKPLAALLLALAASPAGAQTSFGELLSAAPGIYSQDISRPELQAPVRAGGDRLRDAVADKSAAPTGYDAQKAGRLAAVAAERVGYALKGKCYNWVWKDLMAAGFPYEASVPDPSAYQFADWARADADRAAAFGVKIIPTPDSYEEMPLGSIVVYAPDQQFAYGTANSEHGHIEVIADQDGVRYGCSDGCWEVGGRGDFLKTEKAKRDVTVLIPIN